MFRPDEIQNMPAPVETQLKSQKTDADKVSHVGAGAGLRSFPQMVGRLEDTRLLSGRGRYIDDIPVGPQTLHAAILRSPHAHAWIRGIDLAPALAIDGVVAAYAGKDLAELLDPFPNIVRAAPAYRAMAIDKVRYVGEPVAVVLARDRYLAEDGIGQISVDYEAVKAVVDSEAACKPGAPLLHDDFGSNLVWERSYRYGDPERAFAEADQVVRVDVSFPKYNSTPLETYGIVANYTPENDGYEIQGNFQGPFSLLPVMARALRVSPSRLRIILPQDVGGSFGIKAMMYPYMAMMAACARMAGRPVKWIEDRSEHLLASASGTDRKSTLEAAITKDGRILGIRMKLLENVGAYLRAPEPSCVMRSLTTFSGPYLIENSQIDAACVMTNKLPTGLNRGYGGQQYMFSLERLVDRVAKVTGLDRIDVRRRNFLKSDQFPYRTTAGSYYDSGDYEGCLARALSIVKEQGWEAEKARLQALGKLVGIGLATVVHSAASNIGYVTLALDPEDRTRPDYYEKSGTGDFAQVAFDPSGRIRVQIGTAGAGQGHATTVAQIAALELGVALGEVDVVDHLDTAITPWAITTGTYASRFSIVVAGAVQRAAERLGGNIRRIAGHILGVEPGELELTDGMARVKGGSNKSISFRQIAGAVQWNRASFPDSVDVQLQVSETYGAPNLHSPDSENRVNAAVTYGIMVDLAMVEIDRRTFVPKVLKYIAVHDVGRPINPQIIRGQIAGGIVQGIAGALYEHIDYDDNGQALSASFMDYLCPTAMEAPQMTIEHHGEASPFSELGTKGCGENSAMSAPAVIASAVDDALGEFGIEIRELPITPTSIWAGIAKDRSPA